MTVEGFVIGMCALLGLLVGSFLNVVIWRVPRGESIVRPGSHCPRCDRPLTAWDNVPVLSWLVLRARCRGCGERISARYPLVEVLTAVLFGLFAARIGVGLALPFYLYLAAVGVALAFIDLDTRRLPDVLTLPSYGVVVIPLAVVAVVRGDGHNVLRAAVGGVGCLLVYGVLWFFGGMGFGDVKFSGVLGFALGWLGWAPLFVGVLLAFVYGGVISIVLLLSGKARRKSRIPFGPYLIAGAFTGALFGTPIAASYVALTLG